MTLNSIRISANSSVENWERKLNGMINILLAEALCTRECTSNFSSKKFHMFLLLNIQALFLDPRYFHKISTNALS